MENLAWAAGLFEGEGSWSLRHQAYPSARLAMTDEDVVRRFAATLELLGGRVHGPYRGTNKPYWVWQLSGFERVQALYAMLWPWLGNRRRSRGAEVVAAGHPDGRRN